MLVPRQLLKHQHGQYQLGYYRAQGSVVQRASIVINSNDLDINTIEIFSKIMLKNY